MIRDIEGRQNHSVKLARKLQKKKHRRERGLLVGEGLDLLRLAVDAGVDISEVLVRRDVLHDLPQALLEKARTDKADIGVCSEETLAHASSLGGSADVIFVAGQPSWSLSEVDLEHGLTVFLDGVGDPGNVGTIARGGVGFGAAGLVVSPGTADPFGPKAMRAGMGAQFVLPVVVEVSPADLMARLERVAAAGGRPPEILVADPHQGIDPRQVHLEQGAVLVLGSERQGPGDEWGSHPRVTIPQVRFDSLNVAMAGTILLYELTRRPRGDAPAAG